MEELIFESALTPEEIADNFKYFDLFSSLKEGLDEVLAYQRGEEVSGVVAHDWTLPDVDQALTLELVKQVLAWDPDFAKATPEEHEIMEQAIKELNAGEYVTDDQINWD